MSSSFFKPFYSILLFITILVLFLSCFFGPTILGSSSESSNNPHLSIDLTGEYVWPTPRLYNY